MSKFIECFSLQKCIRLYVKIFITATYEEFTEYMNSNEIIYQSIKYLIFPFGQGLIEAKIDNGIPRLGVSNLGTQMD